MPADIFDPEADPVPDISSMNAEELKAALAQVPTALRSLKPAREACTRL